MPAGKLNLPEIDKRATYRVVLTWRNKDKSLVDLTSCSAKLQVRSTIDSAIVLLELSTANNGIVLGGVLGTITIQATNTITSALTWTTGQYDLLITLANGETKRLCEGTWDVSEGITQ